ncbi:putative disease resistance RPP13-like protein 3 [Macadamia integrifolia]|uniref:putative disease resistance RPP13-like protein 3 n=1 Tax=Macadamia integrifolia TaxID=60698 RepID=UPI001C4E71CC|nr:putative disease resistance RPP13-like protein 3 [Macadamia integrifolia]
MAESVLYIAEKLGNLLIKEAEFLHKVKKEVESLSKELKALGSDLKKADVMTNKEEEYDEWVSQLRDLAFKAEDVIEVFVNNETQYDGCNVVQLMMGCICQIITLHKLKNEIDDINIKLKELPKKSSPFTIQSLENGGETSSIHHDREEDQLVLSRAKEDDDIVGFQKEANKLASSLTKKEPQGQVFGQAGAGKTALARNIYKRSDVNNQFDCVAWVSVSPDYHVEDIWQAILEQVKNLTEEEKEKLQGKKSVELLDIVYDCLKEKNYLIVLDDLWKQTDWEMISMAFPKSQEKKCRVLLTTRIEEVARAANPSTDPEILRVLNDEESLKLFLKKVFGCSLDRIPESSLSEEMKDVARQMLSRCEGLPIAIVLLGGILSAKRKDIFEWTNMLEKVRSDLAESTDLRKLFSLSYNELPYASKPCFLYFGLFPEDSVIECDKLIRLWVAEGFIEQRDDKIMEDMARDRLKGLIQRSMIQVVECKSDGDPQTCRTHDLVRSLAIQEAKKAKFSSICKKKQLEVSMEGSCRRIALHPQDFEFHIGTSTSAPFQSIVEMNADLVGVKEEVDRLVMLLTQEEHLGRVAAVSIVGMGGIGKTMLARHVYNKIEVKSYFTCRAWVNVSQHYAVRDILKIILQQVTTLTDAESKLESEDVLQRRLHNHFNQKQQSNLVVLDNIWRTEDWDIIRNIFPEPLNSQSCRMLLTTRSADLVYHVSSSSAPLHLRLLNGEESLKLFLQTIFKCSLDEISEAGLSEDMMDIARLLVNKCAGVPLAIVLLGGLLSVKRKDVAAWVNILQSLKMIDSHFILVDIFYIAYKDLPDYLKSCFLSLRHFPEDTEMACDTLIRLWAVEGFLKLRDNYTLEDAARDYLEELIQRKLIEVAKRKLNGSPETCRIHDLLRDFVSTEARKAEFSKSSENEQLRLAQGNRPLALHSKDSTELVHEGNTSTAPHFQAPKTFSLMDDILSFLDPFKFPNHVYSLLCLSKNPQFCFQQFQLLRVLDLQGAENIMEVPKEIRNLTLLRYLSLRNTRVKQIPSWIGNLRNLQTLDAPGSKIPIDTLKLNQLKTSFRPFLLLIRSSCFFFSGH